MDPEKLPGPNRKAVFQRLFQGRAVKLRGCSETTLILAWNHSCLTSTTNLLRSSCVSRRQVLPLFGISISRPWLPTKSSYLWLLKIATVSFQVGHSNLTKIFFQKLLLSANAHLLVWGPLVWDSRGTPK